MGNALNLQRLRRRWSSVKVLSCADGSMQVKPKWKGGYRKPGVLTRMDAAHILRLFLNDSLAPPSRTR